MSLLGSIVHLMAGSGMQYLIEIMFPVNDVRHMLTGNAISRAVRRHILIDAAFITILVAKAYNIPLTINEKDEPKWDTASTNPETGDEETRSTGQPQGTVDVTSAITEAKELYDNVYCYLHSLWKKFAQQVL